MPCGTLWRIATVLLTQKRLGKSFVQIFPGLKITVSWSWLAARLKIPDYYLTTVLRNRKKLLESLWYKDFSSFNIFYAICAESLKVLRIQGLPFVCQKTPTLKAAGSSPVRRTKTRRTHHILAGFVFFLFLSSSTYLTTIALRVIQPDYSSH